MKFFILLLSLNLFSKSDVLIPAKDFNIDSKTKLSTLKDKIVVLEWYNKDCPFVKKHYQSKNMQALKKKYKEKGVKWVSIISSAKGKQGHLSNKEIKKHLKEIGSDYLINDESGKIGKDYNARTTPHMFIVKNNHIIYDGAIDSIPSFDSEDIPKSKNFVAMTLDYLISGKNYPSTQKNKPYGCSVKYNK